MKGKGILLGILAAALACALVFGGCKNDATDVNVVGYDLPGAPGPADLTIRHSEVTKGYDFGTSKSGTITLEIETTQVGGSGTYSTYYKATGKFTENNFGAQYDLVGYSVSSTASENSTLYGVTIGGRAQDSEVYYYSGTVDKQKVSGASVSSIDVLEPASSIYVVSYKKAALDVTYTQGYRQADKNTFTSGVPGGFVRTFITGYPVKNDLTTDYTAAYDSDLTTYIISANSFLNGDISKNADGSYKFSGWNGYSAIHPATEVQFGIKNNPQVQDYDESYTWIKSPTVKRQQ